VTIASKVSNTGSYTWKLPNNLQRGLYKIELNPSVIPQIGKSLSRLIEFRKEFYSWMRVLGGILPTFSSQFTVDTGIPGKFFQFYELGN
jgi:hypothetical protein